MSNAWGALKEVLCLTQTPWAVIAATRPVDELERRIGQLQRILDVAVVLNATLDQEIQLGVIQDLATELTETEVSSIFLLDGSTGELYAEVATGQAAERLSASSFR